MDQTQEVYRAEWMLCQIIDQQHLHQQVLVGGSMVLVPNDRKFANLESVQDYVNYVTTRLGVSPVTVRPRNQKGEKSKTAHYEPWSGRIAIPMDRGGKWAQREIVVLHELAHHLTRDEHTGHGPKFAGKLLELIEEYVGLEAHFMLRVFYIQNGVVVA